MPLLKNADLEKQFVNDVGRLIEESRQHVAQTVNRTLTLLYWEIGRRINTQLLQNKRAGYGQQIVVSLSRELVLQHDRGFEEKNIRRRMQFAEVFPDEKFVVALIRQLSWTRIITLIILEDVLQR